MINFSSPACPYSAVPEISQEAIMLARVLNGGSGIVIATMLQMQAQQKTPAIGELYQEGASTEHMKREFQG